MIYVIHLEFWLQTALQASLFLVTDLAGHVGLAFHWIGMQVQSNEESRATVNCTKPHKRIITGKCKPQEKRIRQTEKVNGT